MKIKAALLVTVLWLPQPVKADPVTLFFQGLQAGFAGNAIGTAVASALGGAAATGAAIGAFFGGSVLGNILLNVGASYLFSRLNQPNGPTIADSQVNVRLEDAPRWIAGGIAPVGGAAGIFMEYDEAGNLWYIVAHADAELTGDPTYILDGVPVTLSDGTDGFTAGDVITDAFCITSDGDQYEGDGTKVPVWRLYTVTPDSSNVYGTKPSAFTSAFANLPADFNGAGVTYTIVRGAAVKPEKRQAAYRWRGPIGVGEPSVILVGNWTRMYDPREAGHDIDDPTTWTASNGNAAIVWAWFRTDSRGKGQPMSSVNWTQVEAMADLCDTTVLDRSSNSVPLYRAGVAFPDTKSRSDCEAEILMTMDAFVAYDNEGKAYPEIGYYVAPSLTFTGQRDILSAQTEIVDDQENPVDGVVVEYISPDHGYTKQTSAPWVNNDWYSGTAEPRYRRVPIHGCQNHNQAVRLAKAIGQRFAPTQRAALGTTVKGILAKNVRAVTVSYDAQFDGTYEIVSPVEEDPSGMGCRFAVVPLASDRWTLGVGEEGAPPQPTPALNIDNSLELAANVSVSVSQIGNGASLRLEATFDAPSRVDRAFRFRYVPTAGGTHEYFITDMPETLAYSAVLENGVEYRVSWQTVTAGGRATVWSDERDTPVYVDLTANLAAVAYTTLADPAPLGSIKEVSGWRGGDNVTALGDGFWWRDLASGEIVTAAPYMANYATEEYQINQLDRTRSKLIQTTRSDAAYRINSDGEWESIGANIARVDYRDGFGALLVEPSRTNLYLYSDDFNQSPWTSASARIAVTTDDTTLPDGTTPVDRIEVTTATGSHVLGQSISYVSGTTYTISGTVKPDQIEVLNIRLDNVAFGGSDRAVSFRLTDGNINDFGNGITAAIYALSDDWWFFEVTVAATATVTSSTAVYFSLSNSHATQFPSYAGTSGDGLWLWNVQIEAGAEATSPIITGASTASRAADTIITRGITETLDVTVTYEDDSTETFAGASVAPGYWPSLSNSPARIKRFVGRTP